MAPNPHQQLFDIAQHAQQQAAQARRRGPGGHQRRRQAQAMLAAHCSDRMVSATQRRGARAETAAADWLAARGLSILMRNLACRAGEIDLVARDGDTLAFIEVRQRQSDHYGGAAASITPAKQQRICRAARYFLPALTHACFQGRTPPCRFDVVLIEAGHLTWLPHAFDQTVVATGYFFTTPPHMRQY